jgi:chemotaxis protein methyltransferase CheR
LPEFIDDDIDKIKSWSAGCACGEEVYTLKIIWDILSDSYLNIPDLEVLATDMNPIYLERALSGVYPPSSLKEVTKEIQSRYFKQKRGKKLFEVKTFLKKDVTWKVHHLLSDPPDSAFDIIFLRNNVLTYYKEELKIKAFRKVLGSLALNGFLVIGCHETIPVEATDLMAVEPYSFVFKKR